MKYEWFFVFLYFVFGVRYTYMAIQHNCNGVFAFICMCEKIMNGILFWWHRVLCVIIECESHSVYSRFIQCDQNAEYIFNILLSVILCLCSIIDSTINANRRWPTMRRQFVVGNNIRRMVRLKKDEPEKRTKQIVESTHNQTMNKTNNIKLRIIEWWCGSGVMEIESEMKHFQWNAISCFVYRPKRKSLIWNEDNNEIKLVERKKAQPFWKKRLNQLN